MTGLSVQRQASTLSRAAVASAITSDSATLRVTTCPLLKPGSRINSRHNATLQTVAIQRLVNTTSQSCRIPGAGWSEVLETGRKTELDAGVEVSVGECKGMDRNYICISLCHA